MLHIDDPRLINALIALAAALWFGVLAYIGFAMWRNANRAVASMNPPPPPAPPPDDEPEPPAAVVPREWSEEVIAWHGVIHPDEHRIEEWR